MKKIMYVLIYQDEHGFYADPNLCNDIKEDYLKVMNQHRDQYVGAFPVDVSIYEGENNEQP